MDWTLERINVPRNFIVLDRSERSYPCGRNANNKIVCPSLVVSRRHCLFVRADDVISVIDLASSNGIFVNGEHQEPNVLIELKENDIIGIGSSDKYRDNEPMFLYRLHKGNLSSRNLQKFDELLTQRAGVPSNDIQIVYPSQISDSDSKEKAQTLKRNLPNQVTEDKLPVLPLKVRKLSNRLYESSDDDDEIAEIKPCSSTGVSNAKETSETEEIQEIWSKLNAPLEVPKSYICNRKTIAAEVPDTAEKREIGLNKPKRLSLNIENEKKQNEPLKTVDLLNDEIWLPTFDSLNLTNGKESQKNSCSSVLSELPNVEDIVISEEKSESAVEKAPTLIGSPGNPGQSIKFSSNMSSPATRFTFNIIKTNKNEGVDENNEIHSWTDNDDSLKHKKTKQKSTKDTDGKEERKKNPPMSFPTDANETANDLESKRLTILNKGPVVTSSPVKLQFIKSEPMTSFSVCNTVDLSDDDEDFFPSSQLFDSISDDKLTKVEDGFLSMKAENIFEDEKEENQNFFTEVDAVIQEPEQIINVSESEDEENLWLHRLSESQRIKEEMPQIVAPGSPEMEFVDELVKLKQDISDELQTEDLEVPSDERVKLDVYGSTTTRPSRFMSLSEIEKVINEDNELDSIFSTSEQLPVLKERKNSLDKLSDESPQNILGIPKGPKIIEPLSLPQKKRPTVKESIILSDGKRMVLSLASKRDIRFPECSVDVKKLPPNLTAKEKKRLQLEDKIMQKKYENEQKIRRIQNKWVQNIPLPFGKRKTSPIPKTQKLRIVNERREKLKALATKQKQNSPAQSVERIAAKINAKVSTKNRGDFLINEQIGSTIATAPEVDEPSTSKKKSRIPKINSKDPETASKSTTTKKTMNNKSLVELSKAKQESKNTSSSSKDKKQPEKISASSKKTGESQGIGTPSIENNTIEFSKELSLNQKENRVTNSLVQKNKEDEVKKKKKKKKKVTFSENLVTVREFEIDPKNTMKKCTGKDALIPKDKIAAVKKKVDKSQHPKLEEFLMHIFNWNPSWLEEQKHLQSEPPLVNIELLTPMLTNYKSYKDYYQTLISLLLLELWHGITKDFESIDKNYRRQTVFCSIVNNSVTFQPIPSTEISLTTMLLEVLASDEDMKRQKHPVYGDLVFLELCYRNNEGKQNFLKVFAYVTQLYRTVITPYTFFNRDLMNYTANPSGVLTYTVLTRPLNVQLCENRVLRLRCVSYLRANMRMVQGLQFLPSSPLLNLILNPRIEQYKLSCPTNQQSFLVTRDKLNFKQMEAVFKTTEAIIRMEPKICLIQGPPGTGKSEVIVNMVMQILYGDKRYTNKESTLRILLCAPSNGAIDEIVLRLLDRRARLPNDRFKMVRVGLLGTMQSRVRDISVEELAKRDVKRTVSSYQACGQSMNSIEEEKRFLEARINALQSKLSSAQSTNESEIQYTNIKLSEVKMRYDVINSCTQSHGNNVNPKDLIKLQRCAENKILLGADIIACTLSSCYTNIMESAFGGNCNQISVCIVDEATKSCEADTLIPLMLGVNTLVLVGDSAQLPATIISQKAKRLGLDQSLFSRIQRAFDGNQDSPVIMLDVQYRMGVDISYWPNKYFYGGKLKNGLIRERPVLPFHPYLLLNIDAFEDANKFSNTGEAEFVTNLIHSMINHFETNKVDQNVTIGIITPYKNQQSLLQTKINQRILPILENLKVNINTEVYTVDSFQGHERDIIIMSCVRTNDIGFLSDPQRLCVALTRAKHCLVLCGNFATFQKNAMWRALLADAHSRKNFVAMRADSTSDEILSHLVR